MIEPEDIRKYLPKYLSSSAQDSLFEELKQLGYDVQCEVILPIEYESVQIGAGYRVDMLIDDCVIVENKTVDTLHLFKT